ncbi:MAG: Flp pilus assembly protein CpaB [Herbaspirillum sp.]
MSKLTKIMAAVLILLALGMAVLAWWMGRQPVVPPANAPAAKSITYANVVAAKKLEMGKPISAGDLKLLDLPTAVGGAYQNIGSVVGKIPVADIPAGTLIMENSLVRGLALQLAAGERAVAVPVDEVVAAGNRIEAGDYVDVFFTLKQSQGSQGAGSAEIGKSQARLLASRRRVLVYGASTIGEVKSGADVLSGNTNRAQARTVVLATPVDQVNPLLLAMQNGKLTLALRHPEDAGMADGSLFAAPARVLGGRPELSGTQKDALKTVDNQAFAGIDLFSWSGSAAYPGKASRFVSGTEKRVTRTLEVIQGSKQVNVDF